jgi:hypothetical protein
MKNMINLLMLSLGLEVKKMKNFLLNCLLAMSLFLALIG